MKLTILLLSLISILGAQTNYRPGQVVGTPGLSASGMATFATSTAANAALYAVGFQPRAAKTISAVHLYLTTTNGTPGAGDFSLAIYSDSGTGKPGTTLGAGYTCTATPAATTLVACTGMSGSLSASTQYWVVVENANATPTTNYFTFQYGAATTGAPLTTQSASTLFGLGAIATSTNSGSTWTQAGSNFPFIRIDYSDGTYEGTGVTGMGPFSAAYPVYSAREAGTLFTSPNTWLNVIGVEMPVGFHSTPTGAIGFHIYIGSGTTLTLLGTTPVIAKALTGSTVTLMFTQTWQIPPLSTVRVTLFDSSGNTDSSSNYYEIFPTVADGTTASEGLQPFRGTSEMTTCASSCTTAADWTNVATAYSPFNLLLDPVGEFAPPAQTMAGVN